MDTSKEYIEMCEKATEILWKPKNGDFFKSETPESIILSIIGTGLDSLGRKAWLPRQDQLQEMIENPLLRINELDDFLLQQDHKFIKVSSFEQLWLMFVMKEKFNKTWDGKDWKVSRETG
jgi:hypothetical protein